MFIKKANIMEKERLEFNINRFDHYFDSVNNKTAVYIAINTFLLGGIIGIYFIVSEKILIYKEGFEYLIDMSIVSGLLTLGFLIFASIPFLSHNSVSLYYFATIEKLKKVDFIEKSKNREQKDDLKDLREQVHILSTGLTKKFLMLKWGAYSLLFQLIILWPLIIIILKNIT